jgi:tetratricopeptide (TPR) repeat protein
MMSDFPLMPLLLLVLVLPVMCLSVFAHELGHALMGRWRGFHVTCFGVGLANPVWVADFGGTRAFFCRSRPSAGLTLFAAGQALPPRTDLAWIMAGGILANGLLCAAFAALWFAVPAGGEVCLLVAAMNGWMCAASLIPFTARFGNVPVRSDGGQILQLLRGGPTDFPAPCRAERVVALRPLLRSIGDLSGEYYQTLLAALAWSEMGDADEAARLCAEAEALPVEPRTFGRALGALVRGTVAGAGGRRDDAEAALAESERQFQELKSPGGLLLAAMARAEVLQQDDPEAALPRLEELLRHPKVQEHGSLGASLLATRASAAAALEDADRAERLRAEYEAAARRFPSASRDRGVYLCFGRAAARRGEWAAASDAYSRAVEAARELHPLFTDVEQQARFIRSQEGLLEETHAALRAAGRQEDLERLTAPFPDSTEFQRRQAEEQRVRNRSQHRFGLLATGGNALVAGVLLATGAVSSLLEHEPLLLALHSVVLLFGLLLCTGLTAAYLLFLALFGNRMPALREGGGTTTLRLAIIPWTAWTIAILLTHLDIRW